MNEIMNTKFTPGPWHIEDGSRVYADADCLLVASTGYRRQATETFANARLIAAAPDLLEALKVLLYEYSLQMEDENLRGDPDLDFDQFTEVIQARAALKKATGE